MTNRYQYVFKNEYLEAEELKLYLDDIENIEWKIVGYDGIDEIVRITGTIRAVETFVYCTAAGELDDVYFELRDEITVATHEPLTLRNILNIYREEPDAGSYGYLSARLVAAKFVDAEVIANADKSLIEQLNTIDATPEELKSFVLSSAGRKWGTAALDGEGDLGWDIANAPVDFIERERKQN